MAWHGMAWHGMAWHGMAWHGLYVCMNYMFLKVFEGGVLQNMFVMVLAWPDSLCVVLWSVG